MKHYINKSRTAFAVTFTACLLLLASCVSEQETSERIIFNDPETGNEIWQISTHEAMSNMPYFEVQAFTYDDEYVVFKSWREDGTPKIFRSRMKDGVVKKVSDRTVLGSYTIGPDGNEVWFMEGKSIYAVNVKTLKERLVIDASEVIGDRESRFASSFTNDGRYITMTAGDREVGMDIFRIDLSNNHIEKVFSYATGLSHPLLNPTDPNIITFVPYPDRRNNPDFSKEERARNWIIDVEKKEGRPFLMTELHHRTTHETWSPDGERMFFFRKFMPGTRPVEVCSMDKNAEDLQVHYLSEKIKLGHGVQSRDGKWFVSDAQDPYTNPLILLNLETGEAITLCWPNSTQAPTEGNPQEDHVHPSFSHSGKYIAYTTDMGTGVPQAFVIPIEKFISGK